MATTVNTNLNAKLRSIYEKLFNVGEILVLALPTTDAEAGIGPDIMAEFFRVTRKNFLFAAIPFGSGIATVTSLGFAPLALDGIKSNSTKQQIFSIANTNQFIVYHAAICTDQNSASLQIGIQNPAGQLVNGFATPQPPDEAAANDDVFGWFRDDFAQNNSVATELTEQIYIYNMVPNFAIRNVSASTISGNILVHGAGYQLQQIVDPDVQDKIIAGRYKSITKFKTYGAMLPFSIQVPPQWTPPRKLTSTELSKLDSIVVSSVS